VLFDTPDKSPVQIAEELNLIQDVQADDIRVLAGEVLKAWPDKVENYRKGNKGMLGLFMGELMKKTGGKANPKVASEIILELLKEEA
jgi:aspartyl-tRNA(Asn)/glutamyl-tRNA(Gln) amidotransferase subunit B